jgi:O-acetyl-ADP-ribose deacetylase (regulator of RNase III)
MQRKLGNVVVECVVGDITNQPGIDAVVNAANASLRPGGGVAGAIHQAAGPELDQACRSLAPIRTGEAVITPAFALPNKHVIHCLGPVYGRDELADELLASCYRNALALAEQHQLESMAFPAISTGIFGYPLAEAAGVAMKAVASQAPSLKSVRRIRFVLWDNEALRANELALASIRTGNGTG